MEKSGFELIGSVAEAVPSVPCALVATSTESGKYAVPAKTTTALGCSKRDPCEE
jgi:hypothetical protein